MCSRSGGFHRTKSLDGSLCGWVVKHISALTSCRANHQTVVDGERVPVYSRPSSLDDRGSTDHKNTVRRLQQARFAWRVVKGKPKHKIFVKRFALFEGFFGLRHDMDGACVKLTHLNRAELRCIHPLDTCFFHRCRGVGKDDAVMVGLFTV